MSPLSWDEPACSILLQSLTGFFRIYLFRCLTDWQRNGHRQRDGQQQQQYVNTTFLSRVSSLQYTGHSVPVSRM